MAKTYCCEQMRTQVTYVCEKHSDPFDCADNLIHEFNDGRFGLIIHDGGTSSMVINYCPWCGAELSRAEPTRSIDP